MIFSWWLYVLAAIVWSAFTVWISCGTQEWALEIFGVTGAVMSVYMAYRSWKING